MNSNPAFLRSLICMFIIPLVGLTAEPVAVDWQQPAQPWQRHTIDNTSRGADGCRLADFNHDGLPDVVTGWEEGGQVRLYLHPGNAAVRDLWPQVTVGAVKSPEDAVPVDIDGDGDYEVLSSCEGGTQAHYLHQCNNPTNMLDPKAWTTVVVPATHKQSRWMFALPFELDGKPPHEVLVGSKEPNGTVGVLLHDANQQWQYTPWRPAKWIMTLATADMDNDGDMDLVFSDRKGRDHGCFWLERPASDATTLAQWSEHRIGDPAVLAASRGDESMFLDLADFNGDRRIDVVVGLRSAGLALHTQTDGGWRTEIVPLPTGTGGMKAVKFFDADGDGRLEIACTREGATDRIGVFMLKQASNTGHWLAHDIAGTVGTKFDLLQALDLDGDGDLDLMTCEERENLGVIWYENPQRSPAQ